MINVQRCVNTNNLHIGFQPQRVTHNQNHIQYNTGRSFAEPPIFPIKCVIVLSCRLTNTNAGLIQNRRAIR